MSTWEDQDYSSSSKETKEEANLYQMANITSKELESHEEVNLNDVETLQSTYHELLSNSSMLSKAYQTRENISKTSQVIINKFKGNME